MEIVRSELEVLEVINTSADIEGQRTSLFPDLTYEAGIRAFYNWLTDTEAPNPVEQ